MDNVGPDKVYQHEVLQLMSPGVTIATVCEDSEGQRLDNFLIKILKGVPKSLIYRKIRKGEVRVNKARAKPETRLALGDLVRIPPLERAEEVTAVKPGASLLQHLQQSILFESAELLVVNKPSGLAVHGGSGLSLGLIEALRAWRGDEYLELIHRLDRDTSGCVMIAKKRSMLRHVQGLLRAEKAVEKHYWALVHGSWPKRKELVSAPLLKKEERAGGERIVQVDVEGKHSKTLFKIIEAFPQATLLDAYPLTGRTHQIRVHAAHIGHPLGGDDKYADKNLQRELKPFGLRRLFLHAHSLRFTLPNGEEFSIKAPLPDELELVLHNLRQS